MSVEVAVQVAVTVLGVGVVLAVFVDVAMTNVSTSGSGGPVTRHVGRGLWALLRAMAAGPDSRWLSAAGPLVLFALLAVWLAGLWLGWGLVLVADPGSVVDPQTGEVVSSWSRIYLAGFATFTLGTGDLAPASTGWQLISVVIAASGFVLLTMTVSYLLPVTRAVTLRRAQGMRLHGLGGDAESMLRHGWDGASFAPLTRQLQSLIGDLADLTQSYASYPIIHYFHPPQREVAAEPGLAALHEVLCVLEAIRAEEDEGAEGSGRASELGLDTAVLRQLREVLDRFCDLAGAGVPTAGVEVPPTPDLAAVADRGVAVPRDATARFSQVAGQRRLLHALAIDARWTWRGDVVAGSRG